MEDTRKIVKELISDVLEVEIDEIQDGTRFVEDLDADSLKALELLAVLEKKFKVRIPESNLKRFTTLNDTLEVLQEVQNDMDVAIKKSTHVIGEIL